MCLRETAGAEGHVSVVMQPRMEANHGVRAGRIPGAIKPLRAEWRRRRILGLGPPLGSLTVRPDEHRKQSIDPRPGLDSLVTTHFVLLMASFFSVLF